MRRTFRVPVLTVGPLTSSAPAGWQLSEDHELLVLNTLGSICDIDRLNELAKCSLNVFEAQVRRRQPRPGPPPSPVEQGSPGCRAACRLLATGLVHPVHQAAHHERDLQPKGRHHALPRQHDRDQVRRLLDAHDWYAARRRCSARWCARGSLHGAGLQRTVPAHGRPRLSRPGAQEAHQRHLLREEELRAGRIAAGQVQERRGREPQEPDPCVHRIGRACQVAKGVAANHASHSDGG